MAITKAWQLKSHNDRLKKRTPKFVGEIQSRIDNDLSKSIRSIVRGMIQSQFLIRSVVLGDILYFS